MEEVLPIMGADLHLNEAHRVPMLFKVLLPLEQIRAERTIVRDAIAIARRRQEDNDSRCIPDGPVAENSGVSIAMLSRMRAIHLPAFPSIALIKLWNDSSSSKRIQTFCFIGVPPGLRHVPVRLRWPTRPPGNKPLPTSHPARRS